MTDEQLRAEEFERHRSHLRAVAYRMLGSRADADDAVQEAWLRFARADITGVRNIDAWLTTVVSRLCLDALRERANRPAAGLDDVAVARTPDGEPEDEAVLADSVGRAMLVVLDRLDPASRVAFVLHDLFAVPFADIASLVGRSTIATKKLASRARRRVSADSDDHTRQDAAATALADAFLAAARHGDVEAILRLVAPSVVRRADTDAVGTRPLEVRGARAVAEEIAVFGSRSRVADVALIDGSPGIVVAPRGCLQLALLIATDDDRIVALDLVGEPEHLRRLDVRVTGIRPVRAAR